MSKWKCGICNSEFDNFQAQGFNSIIYCPLCYFKELYKREKNKNDKVIEYIKHSQSYGTMAQVMPHLKPYVNGDDILEILGDKENE